MDISSVLWLILLVVFLMMEASTVALVSIWCGFGALAALIASVCGAEIWLECVLFLSVTVIMLAALRPFVKRFINPKLEKTNADALIGSAGMVIAPIDNLQSTGKVKLGAMEWSARSTSGEPIGENTVIEVDRIEGAKVFVSVKE